MSDEQSLIDVSAEETFDHGYEDSELLGRQFQCPCCRATLQVRIQVLTRRVRVVTPGASALPPATKPSKARATQISELMNGGPFMNAFLAAFVKAGAGNIPRDPAHFFTYSWLKKVTRLTLPGFAIDRFQREFGDGYIEVYGAEGVEAVVVNKRIRQFIPRYMLFGRRTEAQLGVRAKNAPIIPPNPQVLDDWIRTKYGYVVDEGPFFDELMSAGRKLGDADLRGSLKRT